MAAEVVAEEALPLLSLSDPRPARESSGGGSLSSLTRAFPRWTTRVALLC